MKVAITSTYQQNRARFPAKDLKAYDGQWVAFSADGRHIIANGDTIAQLSERVGAAQEDIQEVVLERVEVEAADIQLGGAELQ